MNPVAKSELAFPEGHPVFVRRLGSGAPGEYRGIIRGTYAVDPHGIPDAYIVEMIDFIPQQTYSCIVFTKACIDSGLDFEVSGFFEKEKKRIA